MIEKYMIEFREQIALRFHEILDFESGSERLSESILYSVRNGGKMLRPVLLLMSIEAFGQDSTKGLNVAVALEMVHTYSLIHDDLPAMDDDDLRRGMPTNHKVFGEAMAILAGDGMLTHAFAVIAEDCGLDVSARLELVRRLSISAGPMGMVAGQALDMDATSMVDENIGLENLKLIHNLKTSKLIEFAVVAGAIIAGQDEGVISKLEQFAAHLGLAFQIKDDILDFEGDEALIGKPVGSDDLNEKSTYVTLSSIDEAKNLLALETEGALRVLDEIPGDTAMLKELVKYLNERTS